MKSNLEIWHEIVKTKNTELLRKILAENVVFHSPVVHMPQKGRELTFLYLSAALQVFLSGEFTYIREVADETETFLEFEAIIEGVMINGIDMITWNHEGKIIDFKVMIRPLKAINLIHQKMGSMLEAYQKNKLRSE